MVETHKRNKKYNNNKNNRNLAMQSVIRTGIKH